MADRKNPRGASKKAPAPTSEASRRPTTPSNANNFRGPLNAQVNPRTGKLKLAVHAPVVPGIAGMHLDLGIDYVQEESSASRGVLGLAPMWRYRMSYIVDGQITIHGQQRYTVDPGWPSGMKYYSLTAPRLETHNDLPPLPFDHHQSYLHTLVFLNGEKQFFDLHGRLIAVADAHANHTLFSYNNADVDVRHTTLREIVDTYGQRIRFDYPDGDIRISLPEGGANPLRFTYQIDRQLRLTGYLDPAGRTTSFTYDGGEVRTDLVSRIDSPNQLSTAITYGTTWCNTPAGRKKLDVVSRVSKTFADQTSTTRYDFNPTGDNKNYTGYPTYETESSADSLLESGDNRYRYVTTVDDGVTLTRHTYNNLHLELQTDVCSSASPADLITRTVKSYPGEGADLSFPPFSRLSANYQMPTEVVRYHYNPGDSTTRCAFKTTTSYNTAGQVTQHQTYTSPDGESFAQIDGTSISYDPRFGQMLEKEVSDHQAEGQPGTPPVMTRLARTLTGDGSLVASTQIGRVTRGRFSPFKTTSYRYNGQGRVTQHTYAWADGGSHNPESTSYHLSYTLDSATHRLTVERTDALNATSSHTIDTTTGFHLASTDARGHTSRWTYDGIGRKTSAVDAAGITRRWSYDDSTHTTTVDHADGYAVYLTYDGFGQLLSHADNAGAGKSRRTLYLRSYDSDQRLVNETGILGSSTRLSYSYDHRGRLATVTDAMGNVRSYTYDAVSRTRSESFNGVSTQTLHFDDHQRVIEKDFFPATSSSPLLHTTGYNSQGQVVARRLGSSSAPTRLDRSYTLDPQGQVIDTHSQGGDGTTATRTLTRNLFGHLATESRTLTSEGATVAAVGPTLACDALGRLVRSTSPSGQSEIFTYDGNGNLTSHTDFSGTALHYAYNALDALTDLTFEEGGTTHTLRRTYDAESHRLTAIEHLSGNTRENRLDYGYTPDGKLSSVSYSPDGHRLEWDYDPATDQLVSFIDAAGVVTRYSYTPCGQLHSISRQGAAAETLTFSYFSKEESAAHSGKIASVSSASGLEIAYTYDDFDRVSTMTASRASVSSSALLSVAYDYDATTGNVTRKSFSSAHDPRDPKLNYRLDYTYDGLGRLIQETFYSTSGQQLATLAYRYDAAGNLVDQTLGGPVPHAGTTRFLYDADNKLVEVRAPGAGNRTLRYDENGSLVDDGGGRTFRYNALGQLVGYEDSGESTAYTYYPDGSRASKAASGSTPVRFYYDHLRLANVVNEVQGSSKVSYQMSGARRFSRTVGTSATQAFFFDRQNVAATLAGGSVTGQRFDAYGRLDPLTSGAATTFDLTDNPFGYAGEYRDAESGLYYLRARYYDPELRRFLSRDSLTLFNRYSYCFGNPVMLSDPSGHSPWWEWLTLAASAVASIAATVATAGALSELLGGVVAEAGALAGTSINVGINAAAGATGAIAGDAVSAIGTSWGTHHWAADQFFNKNLGIDIGASVLGGAVGAGLTGAGVAAGRSLIGESGRLFTAARAAAGFVGGAVGGGLTEGTKDLAKTGHLKWKEIAEKGAFGGVGGAVGQFGSEIKAFASETAQKALGRGSYELPAEPAGDDQAEIPTAPDEAAGAGAGVQPVRFRTADFDTDLDAPVPNASPRSAGVSTLSYGRDRSASEKLSSGRAFRLRRHSL